MVDIMKNFMTFLQLFMDAWMMPIWNIKKNCIPCLLYDFRSLINLRLWTSKVYVNSTDPIAPRTLEKRIAPNPESSNQ